MRQALVIGAGLAGAAACIALARRGWAISLLDAAQGPAQAASALPVGMLSPHVTRAPTPLSRLSAVGVADTQGELQRLVPSGQGWQACEIDNLGHDPGRWSAALVRPAALVQAWLAEAGRLTEVHSIWGASVQGLERSETGGWLAMDDHGQPIARGDAVVVAGAWGSLGLLNASLPGGASLAEALPLRPVKGQMSLGPLVGPPAEARPRRDNGVFVPCYEDSGLSPQWPARVWSMGSTYERGEHSTHFTEEGHTRNAESLSKLSTSGADNMRRAAQAGELQGWAQVRCASLDRLPLVGAVPDVAALHDHIAQKGSRRSRLALEQVPRIPGIYTLCALGSRGITLAHTMGSLLGCLMDGEAPSLESDLVQALDPARFAWRHARRQPT
jgi:tRNA 5-methylaminomethyl-2-thiouridine biosynthesis bifunctional protein